MKHDVGDFLYSKNSKYENGNICDIKNEKYFIDTGVSIVEVDKIELEHNFYGETPW